MIRGDTADECVGVDFGEQEYLAVLEFLQCMSNIVINDGGTGLFAKLQVGTLLHGDKYVFVTEASQLGYWSIGQVFSRYRNYEGEKERPLTEEEMKHLRGLMDEATIVVDKFVESDPEQVRWHTRIRESLRGHSGVGGRDTLGPGTGQPGGPGSWRGRRRDARRQAGRWPSWCCAASTGPTAGARASLRRRQNIPATDIPATASGVRPSRQDAGSSEPLPPGAGPDSPDAELGRPWRADRRRATSR